MKRQGTEPYITAAEPKIRQLLSAVENSSLKRQKAAESVFGNVASNLADGFSSDKIDAKVVEDILKEFLN